MWWPFKRGPECPYCGSRRTKYVDHCVGSQFFKGASKGAVAGALGGLNPFSIVTGAVGGVIKTAMDIYDGVMHVEYKCKKCGNSFVVVEKD